ncbi:MAG: hypothetical protein IJX06_01340 [Clostridia bacterium]|nr:hypothetical protein [Clostridia bacterium]
MNEKKFVADYPELLEQWDWDKNIALGYDPKYIAHKSKKKVWWKCKKGHSYQQPVDRKTVRGYGCPVCNNSKIVKGINDLATVRPDIAKEWHPTKNGDLTPFEVSYGSGKKVWWQCSKGHEYLATVHDRTSNKNSCPVCNRINRTSFPEQAIFYYVHKLYPNTINGYKAIFDGTMELDIFVPEIMLGIEYDGKHWHSTNDELKREQKKYSICKEKGIRLVRIREQKREPFSNTADIFYTIEHPKRYNELEIILRDLIDRIDLSSNCMTRKNPLKVHSDIDINIIRDSGEIQKYLIERNGSLAEYSSELVKEWDYEKNKGLTPEMFLPHSNRIVWWRCAKCGDSFRMSINSRTRIHESGCPLCAKKSRKANFLKSKVKKKGALIETHPELAKEWSYNKNLPLTPYDITVGHNKKVWWKCSVCGYEWEAAPNNRKKGVGCPCCSGRVPKIGVNDFSTLHPDIAKEWNYSKNGNLMPNMFLPKSGKKVWWICKNGHEWEKTIRERTNGSSCPFCRKDKRQ